MQDFKVVKKPYKDSFIKSETSKRSNLDFPRILLMLKNAKQTAFVCWIAKKKRVKDWENVLFFQGFVYEKRLRLDLSSPSIARQNQFRVKFLTKNWTQNFFIFLLMLQHKKLSKIFKTSSLFARFWILYFVLLAHFSLHSQPFLSR